MTADGEHIVGPLPELRGFYVAGGCCVGGLSIAPIIGELLAEWIMSGKPPMDLSLLSPGASCGPNHSRGRASRGLPPAIRLPLLAEATRHET